MPIKNYLNKGKNYYLQRNLFRTLLKHEVFAQYKNSIIGIWWIILNPLCMLTIYYFIFGSVFNMKWTDGGDNKIYLILSLYLGIITFNLFAQSLSAATAIISRHPAYVKKIVFPLEVLGPISLCSQLFSTLINIGIFISVHLIFLGPLPANALLIPIILTPYIFVILGFIWLISSLAVYIKDTPQVLNFILSALLFTSPIFYPISAIPEKFRAIFLINPISLEIEMLRDALLNGNPFDIRSYVIFLACSVLFLIIGYKFFVNTKDGFADVM